MGTFLAGVVTGARRVTVLGAATSAGTHHAGQERAPDALRAGGLVKRLEAGSADGRGRGGGRGG